MNAVGIDVSKGKSTVAILRPGGEVVASPFEVSHNPKELNELVTLIKSLDGDSKILMEYTGNYYLPVALFLRKSGLFVSAVNPILVKDYSNKSLSVRKGKTDKKDSLKLAAFALDRWNELPLFSPQSDTRTLLKAFNRQYITIDETLNRQYTAFIMFQIYRRREILQTIQFGLYTKTKLFTLIAPYTVVNTVILLCYRSSKLET